MSGPKPKWQWRKVWTELWESEENLHLDTDALYTLIFLVVHASWQPGDEEGVINWGKDHHTRLKAIRYKGRMHHRTLATALQKLEEAKCIRVEEDGIYLPNYGKWQESADAARKRKSRRTVRGHKCDLPSSSSSSSSHGSGSTIEEPSPIVIPSPTMVESTVPERAKLASYATKGDDPEGLGSWPDTIDEQGVRVRRLAYTRKAAERLAEGYTAIELHRMVHDLARMVSEGAFPADKYTAEYVFSGWLSKTMQTVERWRAGQRVEGKSYDNLATRLIIDASETHDD